MTEATYWTRAFFVLYVVTALSPTFKEAQNSFQDFRIPPYIFENLGWSWSPVQTFSNAFPKSCILSLLSKFHNKKRIIYGAVFAIRVLKATIKGVLAGHTVPMITYSFFETMIVAWTDKE